jgi:hypothetical protein
MTKLEPAQLPDWQIGRCLALADPNVAAPISFLAKAPGDWVSAGDSDYTNQAVYSRSGESLGAIKGLLKGPTGRMQSLLSTSEASSASAMRTEQPASARRIVLDVTKDGLQLASAFQH